jgi:hypothetical protein
MMHIVQVHPVANGDPSLSEFEYEWKFDTIEEANKAIKTVNGGHFKNEFKAVYLGRVNDITGELE